MGQPVALAHIRAVRDPVERPLVDAERLAQSLHVGDGVVGAEELTPRSHLAGARTDGGGSWRREVGAPHLALERLAVERAGARPALVEDHDAVLTLFGRERPGDIAVDDRQSGLPRPTRQHEQHAVWRVDVVARSHLQVQLPASRMRMVERNVEGRARVPGGAGTRVGVVQPGVMSRRSPACRQDGESQQQKQETSPHVLLPTPDSRTG